VAAPADSRLQIRTLRRKKTANRPNKNKKMNETLISPRLPNIIASLDLYEKGRVRLTF